MLIFKMLFYFLVSSLGSIKTVVTSASTIPLKINNTHRKNIFSEVKQRDYNGTENLTLETNGISSSIISVKDIKKSINNSTMKFLSKELSLDEEKGRKIKYKRTGLQFLIKTILALKIIMGILFPLGFLTSKILSWKAVTLSLMAFMLAKILFLKNLLTGKNSFTAVSPAYTSPFFVQGLPNDIWKRQSEYLSHYR